jgi:hypothetical protein
MAQKPAALLCNLAGQHKTRVTDWQCEMVSDTGQTRFFQRHQTVIRLRQRHDDSAHSCRKCASNDTHRLTT